MTKVQMKKYILENQKSFDFRFLKEFGDFPFTKEELNVMTLSELKNTLQSLLDAEQADEIMCESDCLRYDRYK